MVHAVSFLQGCRENGLANDLIYFIQDVSKFEDIFSEGVFPVFCYSNDGQGALWKNSFTGFHVFRIHQFPYMVIHVA